MAVADVTVKVSNWPPFLRTATSASFAAMSAPRSGLEKFAGEIG
jgi:hypothetical protein